MADGAQGFVNALLRGASQQQPRHWLTGKGVFEPLMHEVTDMLAITQAILNEGNFVASKEIKVATNIRGEILQGRTVMAHIPAMPENGSKGVRVTDQDPI